MISLSPDQRAALEQLVAFAKEPTTHITLGGYAGVGKTTLLSIYRRFLDKSNPKLRVAFCSFTGRAVRVLWQKLKEASTMKKQDLIGTIHSLIYSPILDDKRHIAGWKLKEALEADLIVVDEASMVGRKLWDDLLSFSIPVVAVGDHGQLPPIEAGFNLMDNPQIRLEKIHRQAEDNPIIQISMLARLNGFIPVRRFGAGVVKIDRSESQSWDTVEGWLAGYNPDTLIVCGYNHTRQKLNRHIRAGLGFEGEKPVAGDRVICLKNNAKKSIYNGMLGKLSSLRSYDETWYSAEIEMDDEAGVYEGKIAKKQFGSVESVHGLNPQLARSGDFFDFGYALTVHKAQGSQARKVIVFEERFAKMDDEMWRRWLYTAVTRAEEELYVVGGGK